MLKDSFKIGLGIVLIGLAGYFIYNLGVQKGEEHTKVSIFNNVQWVKELAELGTLEVRGNSSTTVSNKDTSHWYGTLHDFFLEQSTFINIPYRAKYGIDLKDTTFKIEYIEDKNLVEINLPPIQLLSLELLVHQAQFHNQKGLFKTEDEDLYLSMERLLYTRIKSELQEHQAYKHQAQKQVERLLTDHFKVFHITVLFNSTHH